MSTRPLLERSAAELAAAIRQSEVSAREVVDAHIARLERVAPSVNPVAADRFARAREEAGAADARLRAAGGAAGELPPLLGVPCTVKESIAVAGMPNCAGLVHRRHHRAQRSAPAVLMPLSSFVWEGLSPIRHFTNRSRG